MIIISLVLILVIRIYCETVPVLVRYQILACAVPEGGLSGIAHTWYFTESIDQQNIQDKEIKETFGQS